MSGIDPRPGIHEMSAEDYHCDPCKTPSLSAHIASLLISHSPKHAWTQHPQLNPAFKRKDEQKFDVGTAAHSILLQGEDIAEVCEFPDWRTNAAKDARDAIRKTGRIPLLHDQWQQVHEMVLAIKDQIGQLEIDPLPFTEGKPEQTLIWEDDETGVLCRARLDWLRTDRAGVFDLKTTSASANPHVWGHRTFWSIGCDLQAAFYCRGVQALTGKWPTFGLLVAECSPPYAISILDLAPSAWELAQRKANIAIRKWRDCLRADHWPSYPRQIASVEMDSWQDADFLRLTYGEEVAV